MPVWARFALCRPLPGSPAPSVFNYILDLHLSTVGQLMGTVLPEQPSLTLVCLCVLCSSVRPSPSSVAVSEANEEAQSAHIYPGLGAVCGVYFIPQRTGDRHGASL